VLELVTFSVGGKKKHGFASSLRLNSFLITMTKKRGGGGGKLAT